MADSLEIQPVIKVTLAHRKALSSCHGAKLNPGSDPGTFTCRECGKPCERVLADPVEVTARG